MTNGAINQPTWALGMAGFAAMQEYWRDAFERSVLFLDVMRQRGNNYHEQSKRTAPHVLSFEPELVIDGRTLSRPVNYVLVRIVPPADGQIDQRKAPLHYFRSARRARAGHRRHEA